MYFCPVPWKQYPQKESIGFSRLPESLVHEIFIAILWDRTLLLSLTIPIILKRKLRHREGRKTAQGHTASRWRARIRIQGNLCQSLPSWPALWVRSPKPPCRPPDHPSIWHFLHWNVIIALSLGNPWRTLEGWDWFYLSLNPWKLTQHSAQKMFRIKGLNECVSNP